MSVPSTVPLSFALIGAWMAPAIWDIVRRQDDMSRGMTVAWYAIILLVPIVGVMAYFVFGKSEIEAWLRGLIVGGGAIAYIVVLAVLLLVSGAV